MNSEELKRLETDLIMVNRFVTKIGAMRNSQIAYFAERQYKDLSQAKALESEVDNSFSDIVRASSRILTAFNQISKTSDGN